MAKKIPKSAAMATGIGIGLIQQIIIAQPGVDVRWKTAGNIITGVAALAAVQYKIIKKETQKLIALNYGFTTLITGVITATVPIVARATAQLKAGLRPAPVGWQNAYVTPTYYPDERGTFVRRPETRAAGFGSDIHRNPMASIPTKIPYNKILA